MIKTKNLFASCLILACFSSIQTFGQSATDSLKQSVNDLQKTVDVLKKIKITGWIQAQYQWAEEKGAANFDGGNFDLQSNQRFMIRRGRVKFTYTQKLSQFVLQINASERGVNLVEIFAKVTDPWTKKLSLTAGVMNRPFGFEIDQSSQYRESPERSRYSQILMPNERDLGAKLTFEPGKDSKLSGLKIDAGFYNGQGIAVPGTSSKIGPYVNDGVNEFDSFKDFIGRISYYKDSKDEKYRYGIGMSHYNGGIANATNLYYQLEGDKYIAADTTNRTFKGKAATRRYTGVELFFSVKSPLGKTTLRGEYIFGTQPGLINDSRSLSALPVNSYAKKATYLREFNGSYAYLIQRIGQTKHELVLKYEWYDPNAAIQGSHLNTANGLGAGDVKYTALGIGYSYYYDENVKFMFYYNQVTNEKTEVAGFMKDLKDNVLTIRMQYRF